MVAPPVHLHHLLEVVGHRDHKEPRCERVVHGQATDDNGIFFNTGAAAGPPAGEFAMDTTKDSIGQGADDASMIFYSEDGGFQNGIQKPPKDDMPATRGWRHKPTMDGVINFPGQEIPTGASNSDVTFGQTTREHWVDFRVPPARRAHAAYAVPLTARARSAVRPSARSWGQTPPRRDRRRC